MEPEKKKMKTQHKEEEKCDLDRLSSLPSNILSHIISFLDTKSAIRISVLSKNYRLAWTLSPCLDFKLKRSDVDNNDSDDDQFPPPLRSRISFELYVNRVLERREPYNLRSFRLSSHVAVASEFVEKCMDYATRHNVQHLKIRGYTKLCVLVKLPRLLLTSTSLVTLHLNNGINDSIQLPKSVFLPNLRGLRLKNFVFSENNFNAEVFSGCPNLEDLVLIRCSIRRMDELKILDVNCLNLKNMEIWNWRSPWEYFDEHMINVNAPRLVLFKFQGYLARVNFKNISPCLKEAYINLYYPTESSSDTMIRTSESLLKLLKQISNVEFLSLSTKTFQVMSVDPDSRETTLNQFKNLDIVKPGAERPMKNLTRLGWPPQL